MSLPSYGQRSDPRAAPDCPRHPGVRSVDYCKRCNRPMCVDCLIPTEVRSICVDCTSSKRGWVRQASRAARMGAPVVTYVMMAICILMYLVTWVFPSLKSSLALVPLFLMSRPWTILTGAFLHGGLLHILFNMLSLYWVGRAIEPVLGWWRFLTVYLVSALGGSAFILAWCLIQPSELLVGTVGASGAVFGLIGAATRLMGVAPGGAVLALTDRRVVAASIAWRGVNAVTGLIGYVPGADGAGIAWEAHAAGFVVGMLAIGPLARAFGRPAARAPARG